MRKTVNSQTNKNAKIDSSQLKNKYNLNRFRGRSLEFFHFCSLSNGLRWFGGVVRIERSIADEVVMKIDVKEMITGKLINECPTMRLRTVKEPFLRVFVCVCGCCGIFG